MSVCKACNRRAHRGACRKPNAPRRKVHRAYPRIVEDGRTILRAVCGIGGRNVVTNHQFVWLPAWAQCTHCRDSFFPFGDGLGLTTGVKSATAERLITVECIVHAIAALGSKP